MVASAVFPTQLATTYRLCYNKIMSTQVSESHTGMEALQSNMLRQAPPARK